MKKKSYHLLLIIFTLSMFHCSFAQYKLTVGNTWLYSDYNREREISISDTVLLFDSLLYYELEYNVNWLPKKYRDVSGDSDSSNRYFIRLQTDGFYEEIAINADSIVRVQPYYYKENAQLNDRWILAFDSSDNDEGDTSNVDTIWARVEDEFLMYLFDGVRTIKEIHYYSDNPQILIDGYSYFNDDLGLVYEVGEYYTNTLLGCFIDGILYGDTSFTNRIVGNDQHPDITFNLEQNYPNPFNSRTTIRYNIFVGGNVKLSVYDILGRKITDLVEGHHANGSYQVIFDSEDFPGIAGGIYYYRLESASFSASGKMIYLP